VRVTAGVRGGGGIYFRSNAVAGSKCSRRAFHPGRPRHLCLSQPRRKVLNGQDGGKIRHDDAATAAERQRNDVAHQSASYFRARLTRRPRRLPVINGSGVGFCYSSVASETDTCCSEEQGQHAGTVRSMASRPQGDHQGQHFNTGQSDWLTSNIILRTEEITGTTGAGIAASFH